MIRRPRDIRETMVLYSWIPYGIRRPRDIRDNRGIMVRGWIHTYDDVGRGISEKPWYYIAGYPMICTHYVLPSLC